MSGSDDLLFSEKFETSIGAPGCSRAVKQGNSKNGEWENSALVSGSKINFRTQKMAIYMKRQVFRGMEKLAENIGKDTSF